MTKVAVHGGLPAITASPNDVIAGAQSIFTFRKASQQDPVPEHRHPMMYGGFDWDRLPASEKVYYCDMAICVFNSFGVGVPDAPVFAERVAGELVKTTSAQAN